jgi:hypothetical protein
VGNQVVEDWLAHNNIKILAMEFWCIFFTNLHKSNFYTINVRSHDVGAMAEAPASTKDSHMLPEIIEEVG